MWRLTNRFCKCPHFQTSFFPPLQLQRVCVWLQKTQVQSIFMHTEPAELFFRRHCLSHMALQRTVLCSHFDVPPKCVDSVLHIGLSVPWKWFSFHCDVTTYYRMKFHKFINHYSFCFTTQKMYRKDFEDQIKGKPSLDLDKTPEFLHVKNVTNLLKEVRAVMLEDGNIACALSYVCI